MEEVSQGPSVGSAASSHPDPLHRYCFIPDRSPGTPLVEEVQDAKES